MRSSAPTNPDVKRGDRIVGGSIIFIGIRCTLQYVVLPFLLPFLGLNSSLSIAISAALELIALAMIIYG